ncbi:hypothetical protein LCGC14_2664280, partial [marine sediment metagenome]
FDDADAIYSVGDTITVGFSVPTNEPAAATKGQIDAIFSFSQSLGADYTGSWAGNELVITIVDIAASAPPTIGGLTLTYQGGNGVQNAGLTSLESAGTSAAITGDWGTFAGPTITSVTADDSDDGDGIYGNDDTITFVFSENTNQPFGPNPTQANLDTLFGAMNLGTAYSGNWTNAQTLVITISDATGGTAPTLGATTFTLQAAGNLKNVAGTSLATTDTSPAITGDWGSPAPQITGAVLNSDNRYLDITFSRAVFDTALGIGAVKVSDFTLNFNRNGGNAGSVSITSLTKTDGSALAGGETVIRVHLSIDGTPIGVETIEIRPATNEIYSATAAVAADTETTGEITLNSQMVEVKEGEVVIRRNIINPGRGEYVALNFRLDKSAKVKITVYDLAGNPVKELYKRKAPAGLNEVRWYGKNKRGRKVVQGVYYIVVKIGRSRHVKKVL